MDAESLLLFFQKYTKILTKSQVLQFLYFSLFEKKYGNLFSVSQTMVDCGLTRPTVIDNTKTLLRYGMIRVDFAMSGARKITRIFPGKISLSLYSNILDSLSTENREAHQTDGEAAKGFRAMVAKMLAHPRYNNDLYRSKSWRFSGRVKAYWSRLVERTGDVNAYCDWWLREKAQTKPFSLGLFCCDSMLTEFQWKTRNTRAKREAVVERSRTFDESNRKMHREAVAKIIQEKRKNPSLALTPSDRKIVADSIEMGVAKLVDGKVRVVEDEPAAD